MQIVVESNFDIKHESEQSELLELFIRFRENIITMDVLVFKKVICDRY